LTKLRQQLVCEKTLANIASELELGKFLNVGHGEEQTDCRKRPKILADCMEAVFAAVYLDMGRGTDKKLSDVIIGLFKDKIDDFANSQATDYKTMLQQLSEQDGSADLRYEITQSGEMHTPHFEAVAMINNNEVGRGKATTKKDAEMAAAKQALKLFGILE
jgi:ribonuclease-3